MSSLHQSHITPLVDKFQDDHPGFMKEVQAFIDRNPAIAKSNIGLALAQTSTVAEASNLLMGILGARETHLQNYIILLGHRVNQEIQFHRIEEERRFLANQKNL